MTCTKNNKLLGLGLISGGLDSLIATLVLKLQNIEVAGLNFKSPFCTCDKAYKNSDCGLNLYHEKLGIKTYFLQKEDDYLEIVRNPKFGYGKNINPCIDCRIYILKKAKEFAKEINADFIFTGEVLNQRPKSQNSKALKIVEEESGLTGKLLRPLSALLLKPTIYEEQGLVDRARLLGIRGRSRSIQLEMARKYNLLNEYFACGGCLLTDASFSSRMVDYFLYNKNPKMDDIKYLKYGRHFRFKNSKIIVGRNEIENKILIQIKGPNDVVLQAKDVVGPTTIIQGSPDDEIIQFAANLTISYSDLKEALGTVEYSNSKLNSKNLLVANKENKELFKAHIL